MIKCYDLCKESIVPAFTGKKKQQNPTRNGKVMQPQRHPMFIALKSRRQERVSLKLDNLAITHPILHFLGSLESSYDMLQDDQKIFFKSWLQPLEKRNPKTS